MISAQFTNRAVSHLRGFGSLEEDVAKIILFSGVCKVHFDQLRTFLSRTYSSHLIDCMTSPLSRLSLMSNEFLEVYAF